MTSYNRLNGVYTVNSYDLCTKVLRNEWGYTGLIMSDWDSTGDGKGNGPISVAVCDTPAGKYEYYGDVRNPDGSKFKR